MNNHIQFACATCPRRAEHAQAGRNNVEGKWCGARGATSAPLLFVLMSPGKDELTEGTPLVGGAGRVTAAAFTQAGININDPQQVRIVNSINCFPIGKKEKITKEQLTACRPRLERDLKESKARIVTAFGNEALLSVIGFQGKKQGITHWRGYVVEPGDCVPPVISAKLTGGSVLPSNAELIFPTIHPAYVMHTAFMQMPLLVCDAQRVGRGLRRQLNMVTERGTEKTMFELANFDPDAVEAVMFDIETERDKFTGEYTNIIERMGIALLLNDKRIVSASELWDDRTAHFTQQIFNRYTAAVLIAFNFEFDWWRLKLAGIHIPEGNWWDPMWAHHTFQPDLSKSLNTVASTWLDVRRWKHLRGGDFQVKKPRIRRRKSETEAEFQKRYAAVVHDQLQLFETQKPKRDAKEYRYNLRDCHHLAPIYLAQKTALAQTGMLHLFEDVVMKALPVLFECTETGLRVDKRVQAQFVKRCTKQANAAHSVWEQEAPSINEQSNLQLHELLYDTWGLPSQYRDKKDKDGKKVSADKEALLDLLELCSDKRSTHHSPPHARAIRALIGYRKAAKRVSTYTGLASVVHPRYGPEGKDEEHAGKRFSFSAATGRITARGPGIHAWEKPLRRMFTVHNPLNELSAVDWTQQELYIQAFLANDDKLMAAVLSEEGVHNYHAKLFGLDKTRAKNFIYGTIFWGSAKAIQHQCRQRGFMVKLKEIVPIQEEVILRYSKTRTWQKRYLDKVVDMKFAVNPMGRRRYFYKPKEHVNKIINFPIQSIGAEMLWRILPSLRAVFHRYGAKLLAPIHDEVLYEHHPSVRRVLNTEVKRIMEQEFPEVAPGFYVPTSCKTGPNWFDMKEQPNETRRPRQHANGLLAVATAH